MLRNIIMSSAILAAALVSFGCGAKTLTSAECDVMLERTDLTISEFKEQDPSLEEWFRDSYGYAVFPRVSKGAAGIGGAHGDGLLFVQGDPVGTASLSQATVGLQLGGQAYRELIFFRNKEAVDRFKRGDLEFSAQASAVAASSGAAANADYDKGVAVFTTTIGGLMYEASIGGQSFDYKAFEEEDEE